MFVRALCFENIKGNGETMMIVYVDDATISSLNFL